MIPEAAVEAAFGSYVGGNDVSGPDIAGDFLTREQLRKILEAAAPYMLAAKVAEAKANNDHIIEGGDGYSAGFHYALHCISPDE